MHALEDDLDGGPADETVRFGFGGTDYEIDLSAKNSDMKIDVGAESPPERLALTLGLVPTPVFHTLVPVLAARALLVGTKLGVFEALGQNPLTAADVAAKLGTEGEATGKLLNAMTGLGYLRAARTLNQAEAAGCASPGSGIDHGVERAQ